MLNDGIGRPPVGSGGYVSWFFFIVVIMLSVAAAGALLGMVGIKSR